MEFFQKKIIKLKFKNKFDMFFEFKNIKFHIFIDILKLKKIIIILIIRSIKKLYYNYKYCEKKKILHLLN